MPAVAVTTDQIITGISSCSNNKSFGPDKLSIFHLKNLGPKAIEYLTALFNDNITSCQIPAIWKSSIVNPIPKPGQDSSLGTSYQPISLLCLAAKVVEALILTTVNTHLLPAFDQHGFRHGHSTTSALLHLTSDVATGFNQRKPPHRTICVSVDLPAAFDTVNHNNDMLPVNLWDKPVKTIRELSFHSDQRRPHDYIHNTRTQTQTVKLEELKLHIHDTHADIITIPETKLTPKANTPKVHNFTTVRGDSLHKAGGGSLHSLHYIHYNRHTFNHKYTQHITSNGQRYTHINNTKHITIANIYIPPRDSTSTHHKTADTITMICYL